MSETTIPSSNSFENVQEIGLDIAAGIEQLISGDNDRQSVLKKLNALAEQVPYQSLFEQSDFLYGSLEDNTKRIKLIEDARSAEERNISILLQTIAKKRPDQIEIAREKAALKKTEIQNAAQVKLEPHQETRGQLQLGIEEIESILGNVCLAWPTENYQPATDEEEDEDFDYGENEPELVIHTPSLGTSFNLKRPRLFEEAPVAKGPFAELADKIPSLMERLNKSVSKHEHAYEGFISAKEVLTGALSKNENDRSEEEHIICGVVYILRSRFLSDPNDLKFLEVYSVDEMISFCIALRKFSKKNRPDFNELEAEILDHAAKPLRLLDRRPSKELEGARKRMEANLVNRRGMTWHSLNYHSARASDSIRAYLFGGGQANIHLKNYCIDVCDRSEGQPNLSHIYQFMADRQAIDIIGARLAKQQNYTKDNFFKNQEIIEQWLSETQELLASIPKEFRLERYSKSKRTAPTRRISKYENFSAITSIMSTIADLRIRADGSGASKTRRHKPYNLDPQGALNHQLKLGHLVENLKQQLTTFQATTTGRTEEITPFF